MKINKTLKSLPQKETPLIFTSGLIIAVFCFAFYLIWDQFLKKDSRLSIGLQVLRKKMNELENLSLHVEDQVTKHMKHIQDKTLQIESAIKQSKFLIKQLENLNQEIKEASKTPDNLRQPNYNKTHHPVPSSHNKENHLKPKGKDAPSPFLKTKENTRRQQRSALLFSQSPFQQIDFTYSKKGIKEEHSPSQTIQR